MSKTMMACPPAQERVTKSPDLIGLIEMVILGHIEVVFLNIPVSSSYPVFSYPKICDLTLKIKSLLYKNSLFITFRLI